MHVLHHCSCLLIPSNQTTSSWSSKYSFTASMTLSLLPKFLPWRLGFSFGKRKKSEGAKSGEYGGRGRTLKPHSVAAAMATCEQVHYPARAERLKSIFLSSSSQSPDTATSVLLHNMHHLSCDLPQDNHPWLLPDYPKRGHHPPCWRNSLKLLRREWARMLTLQV